MGLKVYVKHYLTQDGIQFFKTNWFPKVHSIMSRQDGFISLKFTANDTHQDCIDITLEFKDDRTLQAWIAMPIHDELILELDGYRSRTYWEAALQKDENADPEWETIIIS